MGNSRFLCRGIDIDSDSYVLFICKEETLKRINRMEQSRIDQRIDHANESLRQKERGKYFLRTDIYQVKIEGEREWLVMR